MEAAVRESLDVEPVFPSFLCFLSDPFLYRLPQHEPTSSTHSHVRRLRVFLSLSNSHRNEPALSHSLKGSHVIYLFKKKDELKCAKQVVGQKSLWCSASQETQQASQGPQHLAHDGMMAVGWWSGDWLELVSLQK